MNVLFYCPSNIMGGTEILFSRLIKRCANDATFKSVTIIDTQNGILTHLIEEQKGVYIISDNEDIKVQNAVLITPAKCLHTLYELMNKNSFSVKVCIWQLGSGGFSENLVLPLWVKFGMSKKNYKYLKEIIGVLFYRNMKHAKLFVQSLLEKKAVFFSDFVGGFQTFEDLNITNVQVNDIDILPVFIDCAHQKYLQKNIYYSKELHVGWLGRISKDFKIHSLLYTIDKIVDYSLQKRIKIVFHIIGDGNAMDTLKRKQIEIKSQGVEMILYGIMENKFAVELLVDNADVVVSMGTSALDAAKNGIPTIIVSPVTTQKHYDEIKFRWVNESVGYSLGEFPNDIAIQTKEKDLEILLDDLLKNGKDISANTFNFVNESFTLEAAYNKFYNYIQRCEYESDSFMEDFKASYKLRARIKNISKLYRPGWLPN